MGKKIILIVMILVIAGVAFGVKKPVFKLGSQSTSVTESQLQKAASFPAGSKESFNYLAQQNSNSCGLQSATLTSYPDEQHLRGSCCSSMNLHRYQEQVEGLKKYANISQIPQDPYDISAFQAKELLGYKNSIKLTADQQEIYDQAMKLSHEGGPCCCKCWRWDAFEGQAKYFITEHNFNSQQIADLWDLEDGCGGAGHTHGAGYT